MLGRKSNLLFLYLAVNLILLCLMFIHAGQRRVEALTSLKEKEDMVERLQLTDLCLFTDARYTRHPSMADLNSPFQDYPMSFEHFPSGSLVMPPPHLRGKSVSE